MRGARNSPKPAMLPGDERSSQVVGYRSTESPSMLDPARLHNALIPAVPVPFDAKEEFMRPHKSGTQDGWLDSRLKESLSGGTLVGAYASTRPSEPRCWNAGGSVCGLHASALAAAGGSPGLVDPDQVILKAQTMRRVKPSTLAADAVLVHPPTAFRDRPNCDTLVLEYHAAVAEVGLPLILFYLYEEAGGVRYGTETLSRLRPRPEVLGNQGRHARQRRHLPGRGNIDPGGRPLQGLDHGRGSVPWL